MRRAGQAGQARERALDALVDRVDIPLPEDLVDRETASRRESLSRPAGAFGQHHGGVPRGHRLLRRAARRAVRAGRPAQRQGRVHPGQAGGRRRARRDPGRAGRVRDRAGLPDGRRTRPPGQGAVRAGPVAAVAADVLRGKALTLITERASITDESGQKIDLKADEAAEEALAEADVEPDGRGGRGRDGRGGPGGDGRGGPRGGGRRQRAPLDDPGDGEDPQPAS